MVWRVRSAIALSLVAIELLVACAAFPQPQSQNAPTLLVTPSTTVMLVGETSTLSAVDEIGKPFSDVAWSQSSHRRFAGRERRSCRSRKTERTRNRNCNRQQSIGHSSDCGGRWRKTGASHRTLVFAARAWVPDRRFWLSKQFPQVVAHHTLPPPGQVFQNDVLVSDHSMFIVSEKSAFAGNNATELTALGLPPVACEFLFLLPPGL